MPQVWAKPHIHLRLPLPPRLLSLRHSSLLLSFHPLNPGLFNQSLSFTLYHTYSVSIFVSSHLIAAFNRGPFSVLPPPSPSSSSTYVITLLSRRPWTAIMLFTSTEPSYQYPPQPRILLISVVDQNCCMYVKSVQIKKRKRLLDKNSAHDQYSTSTMVGVGCTCCP